MAGMWGAGVEGRWEAGVVRGKEPGVREGRGAVVLQCSTPWRGLTGGLRQGNSR